MKTLILIRHAHRDTSKGRALDNGLSEKGKLQRQKLTEYFIKRFPSETPLLLSSPSKRCIQTLKEISKQTLQEIVVKQSLKEFVPDESAAHYEKRITLALEEVRHGKSELTLLCSHGDWIPTAVKILNGTSISLKKAGWVEFQIEKSGMKLKNLIQDWG